MLLKNISVGVINVGNKNILPQQTVSVSDSLIGNTVIKGLIKAGKLVEKKEKAEVVEETVDIIDIEEEFERLLEEKPTVAKMKRFANDHGIALEDARTHDEVEAIVKAFIAVTKANN